MIDFEEVLGQAEPGVLVEGYVTVTKVSSGRIGMVMRIGDEQHSMWMPPLLIKALSGKGPFGMLGRMLRGSAERAAPELVQPEQQEHEQHG